MIKIYTQKQNGSTCMFDSIDGIQGSLEVEIDTLYSDDKKSLEEKERLVDENLEKIKALKIGEEIELFAFYWGVDEMSEVEFENLGEFTGWLSN